MQYIDSTFYRLLSISSFVFTVFFDSFVTFLYSFELLNFIICLQFLYSLSSLVHFLSILSNLIFLHSSFYTMFHMKIFLCLFIIISFQVHWIDFSMILIILWDLIKSFSIINVYHLILIFQLSIFYFILKFFCLCFQDLSLINFSF